MASWRGRLASTALCAVPTSIRDLKIRTSSIGRRERRPAQERVARLDGVAGGEGGRPRGGSCTANPGGCGQPHWPPAGGARVDDWWANDVHRVLLGRKGSHGRAMRTHLRVPRVLPRVGADVPIL